MRRVILLFISCCTLVAGPSCSDRVEPLPDDTSLVLVVVDALRSDRLVAWGGDPGVTPCLDRMAGESVRFRHAVSPSSWTKPSVASLMTGFYPGRHGAVGLTRSLQRYGGSTRLDSSQVTLAETLRQAGFSTAAYTTNINISVRNNFHQGFDQFVQRAGDAGELCTGALQWLDGRQPHRLGTVRGT
jgi:arylsulfatase A-like enzyme